MTKLRIERDSMDIYEKINATVYCSDLIDFGHKLIDFVDSALLEKNRASIVKNFYSKLTEWAMMKYVFDGVHNKDKDNNYFICNGDDATKMLIAMLMPPQTSPVKTLNSIKEFGNSIIKDYKKPIGKAVSEKNVRTILNYLDDRYAFSRKVFSNKKAIIALLDYSNSTYNSHCFITGNGKDISQHLFLYHMKENSKEMQSPESVFFHELGHALHARYHESLDNVPQKILEYLKQLCFPTIDSVTCEQQCEIFADILSIGMMYDSPFSKYDPFFSMHDSDKKIFNEIVEKMIMNC